MTARPRPGPIPLPNVHPRWRYTRGAVYEVGSAYQVRFLITLIYPKRTYLSACKEANALIFWSTSGPSQGHSANLSSRTTLAVNILSIAAVYSRYLVQLRRNKFCFCLIIPRARKTTARLQTVIFPTENTSAWQRTRENTTTDALCLHHVCPATVDESAPALRGCSIALILPLHRRVPDCSLQTSHMFISGVLPCCMQL